MRSSPMTGTRTHALHRSLIPLSFLRHSGLSVVPQITHASTPLGGGMRGLEEAEGGLGFWWSVRYGGAAM